MLRVDGVDVIYPNGVAALRSVDLVLAEAEFVVLLGPSGAGKSTLLRCLNGLVAPSAGTVSAEGLGDIGAAGALRRHRRRTGMIFQQHNLVGRVSALANVLIGRLGHHPAWRSLLPLPRADKRLALDCLDRVGLLDKALVRVSALSGGEQQRVGIARALAQEPALLVADEPVASLDPANAERVLALLRAIGETDRLATIVSLHQVELARRFADRILGIVAGRIVFDGPPARLNGDALRRIYGPAGLAADDGPDIPAISHAIGAVA